MLAYFSTSVKAAPLGGSMKKLLLTMTFVVTFFICTAVSASAAVKDTIKVGLRYGSNAMFSIRACRWHERGVCGIIREMECSRRNAKRGE